MRSRLEPHLESFRLWQLQMCQECTASQVPQPTCYWTFMAVGKQLAHPSFGLVYILSKTTLPSKTSRGNKESPQNSLDYYSLNPFLIFYLQVFNQNYLLTSNFHFDLLTSNCQDSDSCTDGYSSFPFNSAMEENKRTKEF